MKNNMQIHHSRELNQAEIAAVAYQKWEHAGRPQGHDLDFWLQAESQLRTLAELVVSTPAKETAKVTTLAAAQPRTQRPLRLPGSALSHRNHRASLAAKMS